MDAAQKILEKIIELRWYFKDDTKDFNRGYLFGLESAYETSSTVGNRNDMGDG